MLHLPRVLLWYLFHFIENEDLENIAVIHFSLKKDISSFVKKYRRWWNKQNLHQGVRAIISSADYDVSMLPIHVTHLSIGFLRGNKHIHALSKLKHLQYLELFTCNTMEAVPKNLKTVVFRSKVSSLEIFPFCLPHLTSADLSYNNMGTNFESLSHCQQLRHLKLQNSDITHITLAKIVQPKLRTLDVSHCYNITELSCLSSLKFLMSLHIQSVRISCCHFLQTLVNLRYLNVGYCFPPKHAIQISQCTLLRTLQAGMNKDLDIPNLSRLTNLETLDITSNISLSADIVSGLPYLQKLKWLELQKCNVHTCTMLSSLTRLEYLQLGANYNIVHIDSLSTLTNLRSLQLYNCPVANIHIFSFLHLPKLQCLSLKNTNVTYAGLQLITKHPKLCTVCIDI